jgi:hypothetical protein
MTDSPKEKTCFVIAPIGKDGSDIRDHSNQVLEFIIKPAMAECGYDAIRADEISNPGIITTDIIQHLINAPLVIAVLTYHNPNVFYELAIRHAKRKPVIQLISAGEIIPFDVHQNRTIEYKLDLPGAKAAKEEIIRQVSAITQHEESFDNPISVATDLQVLEESQDPLAKSHAEIISMLQGVNQQLNILQRGKIASDSSRKLLNILELFPSFAGDAGQQIELLKWYLVQAAAEDIDHLRAVDKTLELMFERELLKREKQQVAEKFEENEPTDPNQ